MSEGLGTITKLQPVIIILAVVIGIVLGQFSFASSDGSELLMEFFLMALLFFAFLGIDVRDIAKAFGNRKFTATALTLNFIWTPIFAVLLGYLFLSDSLDMRIGLLMMLVTPCTDWYIVFTGMAKGNTALSTSILPLNFIVQVIMLPLCLFLYLGTTTSFDIGPVLFGIAFVLIIPFVLANAVKILMRRAGKEERLTETVSSHGDNLQLLFLCLAIVVMFASQGKMLVEEPELLVKMLIPLGVFFLVMFIISQVVAKRLKFSHPDSVSLTMTTLARNSPLDLAIAVIAFPFNPLIALVLVIGPLIELPVLALVANVLLRIDPRRKKENVQNDAE